jgi:lipoprotein-releasing system ATP-binding protein
MVLQLKNITKSYPSGEGKLDVLRGFNLEVKAGEIVALVGPSGCGKTTLLQIAGLLDSADAGEVFINGEDATKANDAKRTALRLKYLGFVYQFHHLLPEFSALENVYLPQLVAGCRLQVAKDRAKELLENFGLGERIHHRPSQLSGGEQQRVAIARALANNPKLLLADEPTGNLDPENASKVFAQFIQYAKKTGLAVLFVTHNADLAAQADRQIKLSK